MPVSDELLSDAPAIQSYLNLAAVAVRADRGGNQILNGNGTATTSGLLDASWPANEGVVSAVAAANAADHIYEAITLVAQSS